MFRTPAKPIEPPTPRTSVLGLDRLAREKRAAAASLEHDTKKKSRNDDEPVFKGAPEGQYGSIALLNHVSSPFVACVSNTELRR